MRILWVKTGGLWPLNVGGRLRSFHIVQELSKRHRVTVLTTHAPGEDLGELARQLPQCRHVASYPYAAPKAGTLRFAAALARSWMSPLPVDLLKWRVPALRAEAEWILGTSKIDLCVADFLHGAVNVPLGSAVPTVLFSHNVESTIWQRLAVNESRRSRRALLNREWRKMRATEIESAERSRLVITVSDVDAAWLGECAPAARVRSIPTGVDIDYFTANGIPERDAHLVFSGAMDWYPNEDAMLFFISEILPRIRAVIPNVTATIVGRNPSARLRGAGQAGGVRITGTVDDVRSFIDEAAVYMVPLRIGGGTRLKIFEALSMGKAVVSTSIGAEGLPLVNGRHFLQADGPSGFSDAVITLLRDSTRRRSLGEMGRELVRGRYSWSNVALDFEAYCEEALHQV